MRKLSSFILKKLGWKIDIGIDEFPKKCVLCVAPHTSNWDLILGKLIYSSLGKQACFLIKKTWFFFPMNLVFKAMGGIPVDRSKKTSLTEQMAEEFNQRDQFQLAITPEGTRKMNSDWKRGFYYIALEAKIPILVIVLNYKQKTVCFKKNFYPTGNADDDIEKIKSYYVNATGKYHDKFATENK